jgi:DNA polymerase-1
MKNNKLILLVDGENILHQSFHKFEKLKSTDGKPSGAIFGFFKSLHMYLNRFDPDKVVISFDNGHSKYREALLPNYKGHRKNISYDFESLQSQKKQIMRVLRMLRVSYIYDKKKISNYEGDDFLAYLYLKSRGGDNKYILISSDKDFNQLLGKDLKIFNPRKEAIVNLNNCKELFGYEASETVDYLSLVGDSSDDIPGLKGYGPVKARKFLDQYGSIEKALTHEGLKDRNLMAKSWERNQQLIDLRWFIENHPESKILDVYKFYKDNEIELNKFKRLCIEYSLNSFMTTDFMKPFNNLINKHYETFSVQ